jgi:hypothetical protein
MTDSAPHPLPPAAAAPLCIRCIYKPARHERRHERIELIGGDNPDHSLWTMTSEKAIQAIQSGTLAFCVNRGGRIATVEVRTNRGWPYLRTRPDGRHPNNLLSLPDIPSHPLPPAAADATAPLRIRYIYKPDRHEGKHERIELIGGDNPDGSVWTMTSEKAIQGIRSGTLAFFVNEGGKAAPVRLGRRGGRLHLRTRSDGRDPNNLLSLPNVL